MSNPSKNYHSFSIAVFDFIAINFTFFLLTTQIMKVILTPSYLILVAFLNIIWVISSYLFRLYIGEYNSGFFKRTIKTFFLFIATVTLFIFFYHYNYSRLFIVLVFIIIFGIFIISRTILFFLDYFQKQYTIEKKAIIIGCNDSTRKLIEHINISKSSIKIMGCFDSPEKKNFLQDVPLIGDFNKAKEYAINNNIAEIYLTVSPETNPTIYELIEEAEKHFIRFKFVPDFRIYFNRRMHVELERDFLFLSPRADPLEDDMEKFKKRGIDIFLSLAVMVLILWWLIPIIAFLIKLESKGPIFFMQLRSGKNNKPFVCYKFRTLKVNIESDEKQVTKQDNRFTTIGRFLRKTNIDELPQFLNVLQNTMSVVGPRPHMLQHTKQFAEISQYYMTRHYLKPGITGWAQINGYRGEIKNKELLLKRIEYDIWYMENWSMWLDMRIILLTGLKLIIWDKNAV